MDGPTEHPSLERARDVLRTESEAIRSVIARIGPTFAQAVELVLACHGRIVVTGMGKAGFIAQKLSATFASTGTPSLFLHPAEALHGDLGRVTREDVVIAFSNSGETEELIRLLPALLHLDVPLVSITGDTRSTLARASTAILDIGNVEEACPMGLAPTASAVALLAMGDALAMAVLAARPFGEEDYARNHPGGKLGQRLRKVSEVMRTGERNPKVIEEARVADAIAVMTRTPGRPGCTSVVDAAGRLAGIFTDGDLRRRVELGAIDVQASVTTVMTRGPKTIRETQLARDAIELMREKQIDQLPVVDAEGRLLGLLDVQDLLSAGVVGT